MTSHTIHTHRWGMRITVAVLAVLLLTMTTLYLLTAANAAPVEEVHRWSREARS